MERIERLESLIPKLKANKKINPLKTEAMEWELRALKAEQQLKNCNLKNVTNRFSWPSFWIGYLACAIVAIIAYHYLNGW